MKKIGISEQTMIVTADIGKTKHYGYFRTLTHDTSKIIVFSNSLEGFEKFWQQIVKYKHKHSLNEIVFAIEPTGSYGLALMHFMGCKGVKLYQVNPSHTKRIKEVLDNSPCKTDNKDPKVIASLVLHKSVLQVNMPKGIIADLRELIQFRETLLEDINRIKNRMESLISQYFPEYLEVMKGLRSKTSIFLLKEYTTPGRIALEDIETLTKKIKQISKGKFGREKAEILQQLASKSIGVKEGISGFQSNILLKLQQLELMENQLKGQDEQISLLLARIPASKFLLSVKGLGKTTSAIILSEVADFNSFHYSAELLKYAGFNLYEISSGKHQGKRRISKRGRSLLRKALFFASLNMVRKGGIFHEKYHHYISKGMLKNKALVALSRKLLTVIFALVRDEKLYVNDYEKYNKLAA